MAEISTTPTISNLTEKKREFFSISELAERWRCSRGTVYNRLRAVGARVLDFAPRGKRGKKVIALQTVLQIERQRSVPLR
jgi:predicted DNA-binding protein YlxM (UPF0122 family)